jgi:Tol biopolymer transport system component
VAFASGASNLVSGASYFNPDIYVRDMQSDEITIVSVRSNGDMVNAFSHNPSISADGRYVAFDSDATDLVDDDTNGVDDIFVHDCQTGQTTRVSLANNSAQAGNGHSKKPSISADGRYVSFHSEASNLVSGDTNGVTDIFVHDRQTGETFRVSTSTEGTEGNDESAYSVISTDGRFVAFTSHATNLVSSDINNRQDVFLHDRLTGRTLLVSVSDDSLPGEDTSTRPSLSADGRFVVFDSEAGNLVSGDTNNEIDVFVRETGVY